MLAVFAPLLKTLLLSLLTEAFLKDLVVYVLEEAVEATDNKLDDKIVASVKEAWGVDSE